LILSIVFVCVCVCVCVCAHIYTHTHTQAQKFLILTKFKLFIFVSYLGILCLIQGKEDLAHVSSKNCIFLLHTFSFRIHF
jgi:hypothetical protein